MKCSQLCEPDGTMCPNEAEFSYLWPPDGEEFRSCLAHTNAVLRIGEALGMKIVLHRIALEEARKNVLRAAVQLCWSQLPDSDDLKPLTDAVEKMLDEERSTAALVAQRAEVKSGRRDG
jgi:hypothetical protein